MEPSLTPTPFNHSDGSTQITEQTSFAGLSCEDQEKFNDLEMESLSQTGSHHRQGQFLMLAIGGCTLFVLVILLLFQHQPDTEDDNLIAADDSLGSAEAAMPGATTPTQSAAEHYQQQLSILSQSITRVSVDPTSGDEPADRPATQTKSTRTGRPAAAEQISSSRPAESRPVTAVKSTLSLTGASQVISQWADAWTRQDVDAYLDCYSNSFIPGKGVSLKTWKQQRRDRIRSPKWIKVETSLYRIEKSTPEKVTIRFMQHYQSPTMDGRIYKVMDLVPENGEWKIASEKVVRS